jgi:hypothetical protein
MMLQRIILSLGLMLGWVNALQAQKEGNVWCFHDSIMMRFDGALPPIVSTNGMGHAGTSDPGLNLSTLADSNGQLICYAATTLFSWSGLFVFDNNHQVMPNGSRLQGYPSHASILIPYPQTDSIIVLLHIGRDSVNTNNFGLFYSRINKTLRGGLGDVTLRDSLVYYGTLSQFKLAACRHGNGRDWWVVIYDYSISGYHLFTLSDNGISFYNTQIIGSPALCVTHGKTVFSNNGTKMMSAGVNGCIDVFDFDRCTGLLSNFSDIGEHAFTEPYQYFSAAFSPNGNVIYVSPWNLTKVFYQYDLTAPNIKASKLLLNQYLDTGMVQWNTYNWHNLGSDGKIYTPMTSGYQGPNVNNYFSQHLDVIEYPDSVGLACNYKRQAFNLGGHFVAGSLPNMPYYGLSKWVGSVCDTIPVPKPPEVENGIVVFPNPTKGELTVKLKNTTDAIQLLTVFDMLGQVVLETTQVASPLTLHYDAGVYVLKVNTVKEKEYIVKVVKQ